jgi:hypothetical protein
MIDPLATTLAWSAEGDQAYAWFGYSVSTVGDVNGDGYSDVVVGAPGYDNGQAGEGRAFTYHGSAGGLSVSPAWTAESDQTHAEFGTSVGTAGDVNGDGNSDVIVGAPGYDNGQADEGRAFTYHGSAAGLSASAAWTAESDQSNARFGSSVGTSGDVNGDGYSDVIVGAEWYGNGQLREGRVFAYHGAASGLSASAAWTAESDEVGALLGTSAATAGDVNGDGYADVIVGAPHYNPAGEHNYGRVFVYYGSALGLSSSAGWTAAAAADGAFFGGSVATAGDVNSDGYADVIVGARVYHEGYDNGEANMTCAFAFYGSAAGLPPLPSWTVPLEGGVWLEFSVNAAGDVNGDGYADVILGGKIFDSKTQMWPPQVMVHHGSATGLSAQPSWGQTYEAEPTAVGTAGDVNGDGYADVIVGAPGYIGQALVGRAFAYHGSAAGLSASPGWSAEGNRADARFSTVGTAGDVNGDGYADVIVGAPLYDNGQFREGRAFAYHGSDSGLSATPAWTAEGDRPDARFGHAVATAGDVDGDGFSDVILGAFLYDNGQAGEGRAFAYHGSTGGLLASPAWTAEGDQTGAEFGFSVGSAGDVNGDGYADVVVGARSFTNGEANEGRAFGYHGSAAGLAVVPAWTAESDQNGAAFGNSVGTAGDVNGDGYSDVIVGAEGYDSGQTDEGRVFAYHGSAGGLSASAAWTAEGNQSSAYFGGSVGTAGDVDGDGYSDVIVGARLHDNGQSNEGRAFVYEGSATGLSANPVWTAESDQADASLGYSVGTAGDVNGDGYADVIVGAWLYANGQNGEGRALAYHGSAAGLSTSPSWVAESNQAFALFGASVGTAGDVNGDGYADVLVGSYGYDNGQTDEGRAFLYYGNDGPGLSMRPRQRRVGDLGPIVHLGASDSPDAFRLELLGHTPFARGRVQLEWEVEPLGQQFDGIATGVGLQAHDTGTAGVELSELAADLSGASPHHWRVRLRYDPVTTPFAQHSRWLTVPWRGWQETMLRTAIPSSGRIGALSVGRASGLDITLSWDPSCVADDSDYAIYEGLVGDFTSHGLRYCSTDGATTKTLTPGVGDTYYLVVPRNSMREGSYGADSEGNERPQSTTACLVQQASGCP